MRLLRAPLVFTGFSPLIENGGVLLGDDGRIASVGAAKDLLKDAPGAPVEDFPDSILLPPLVNCHAHLELAALPKIRDDVDFTGWLGEVVAEKKRASPADFERGIKEGIELCRVGGQGVIADVASATGVEKSYGKSGARVVFTPELICLDPSGAAKAVENALGRKAGGNASWGGVFAHAPYTVCEEAYLECAKALRREGLLFTHAAESPEEVEYCLTGKGAIPERLFGNSPVNPPPSPGLHPIDWLDKIGVLGNRTVLVHCVQLGKGHVNLIAARRARVVLCPRSNKNLGVGSAPALELLRARVNIGLGTDSILSAGDLDLWKEVTAAVDDYGFSPEDALFAGTSWGARVLGLEGESGSLSPGRRAAILVRKLGEGKDRWERIFSSSGENCFYVN